MSESLIPLALPATDADYRALGSLLAEAVADGAAVSFRAGLTAAHAERWWRDTLPTLGVRGELMVARVDGAIIGCAMLLPAWAPNQPHRADVAKVLVRRAHRGRGLATRLMHALERGAHVRGFTLLTLDCKQGAPAERMYRKLGWTEIGSVPNYALDPDGTPHGAVMFYKALDALAPTLSR